MSTYADQLRALADLLDEDLERNSESVEVRLRQIINGLWSASMKREHQEADRSQKEDCHDRKTT